MNQDFVKPLIKKANQIADNMADVDATALHISRFWTLHMKEEMSKHMQAGGEGLNPEALKSLKQVMKEFQLAC